MKKIVNIVSLAALTIGTLHAGTYRDGNYVYEEGSNGSSVAKGALGGAATGAVIGGIAGGGRGAGYGALAGGVLGMAIGSGQKKTKVYTREQVNSWQRQKDDLYKEYQRLLNEAGALSQQANMSPYNIKYNPGKYADNSVESLRHSIKALQKETSSLHKYINKAQNALNKQKSKQERAMKKQKNKRNR